MRACTSVFFVFGAALMLAGCPNPSDTSSGGGGNAGGGSATTGGGGSGGAVMTTTTTTEVPLTCSAPVSTPALTGECDLLQQDCPVGQTCAPGASGTICQSGGGLKGPGKTCNLNNGNKECQAGLFCIGANSIGICTRPCCTDNNEPCGGGDCNGEVDFGNVIVKMCSYSEQCDLFVAGDCPEGLKCQLVYPSQGLAVCTLPAPESKAEGESCQFVNQCGENQVCYGTKCRYNCNIDGSGEPGAGTCLPMQTCTDVYQDSSKGVIGVCQPAP